MTIIIQKQAPEATLSLSGRLDTVTSPQLEATIREKLDGVTALTLDLAGLTYISSAGLRVLLTAQKHMQAIGTLKLTNVQDDVMSILEMTGFADILTIE